MLRELPMNSQIEMVKNVINQLIERFQDTIFSTKDIMSPPFRHVVGFCGGRINLPNVLNHLVNVGEIEITREDNTSWWNDWNCGIIEFKVTEKYGKLPEIQINVPIAEHVINSFNAELPRMMQAYALLASLENKLRFFIKSRLEAQKGSDWWDISVPQSVKDHIKNHRLTGWHIELPKHDIQYTDFSDLIKIINNNWEVFKPIFKDQNHIKTYLEQLEIPRNTIAHSNVLSKSMMQELEINSGKILNLIDKSVR